MIFMTAVVLQLGVSLVAAQETRWDAVKSASDQEALEHSHVLVKENVREGGLVKITLSNGINVSIKQDASKGWAPSVSYNDKAIQLNHKGWVSEGDLDIYADSRLIQISDSGSGSVVVVFSNGATLEAYKCHHHNQVFTSHTTPDGLSVMELRGALLIKGEGRVECGRIDCMEVIGAINDGSITTLDQIRSRISRRQQR